MLFGLDSRLPRTLLVVPSSHVAQDIRARANDAVQQTLREMNHSLTATNLSIYQHLNCDLYIHNVYTGATASASPEGSSSPSEFTRAHCKRGLDWESVLYTWLDRSNLLLRIPSIPLEASDLLENILYDDRTHFFIAGITFRPPQAELEAKFKAASTASLGFGLAKPDLLEIHRTKDGIEWRVIDAKASHRVKVN